MGLGVAGTAAAIGAAGSIGGAAIGALGSKGQSSASGAGAAQAQAALAQQRADLSPFRTTGVNALGVAGDLSGANGPDAATAAMADFHTDPGYQFQLDQGLRAIDAGAASKGILHSGATIKGEETFGTGLADQSFSQYYNRLYGLANLGETAAAGGAATANSAATLAQGAGNTQGSIFGNAANTLGSTLTGLGSNPAIVGGINSLFNSDAVTPAQNTSNVAFQAGAFAQQPPGTFGPFK